MGNLNMPCSVQENPALPPIQHLSTVSRSKQKTYTILFPAGGARDVDAASKVRLRVSKAPPSPARLAGDMDLEI